MKHGFASFATATFVAALFSAPLAAQNPPSKDAPEDPAPAAGAVSEELRKEIDSIQKDTGAKFTAVVEREHFALIGAIAPAQAGPILDAAEKTLALFCEWTGSTGTILFGKKKCLIVVMPSRREFQKLGDWYEAMSKIQGNGSATKFQSYIWWCDPRCMIATHLKPYDVAFVRQIVIHETGHVVARAFKYNYNFGPEWFEEGMAAYMEARIAGLTNCYCFKGGYGGAGIPAEKMTNLKWDLWKAAVKAEAKSTKSLSALVKVRMNELTAQDIGKAWSLIDYMVKTDPKKFAQWLAAMRREWPKEVSLDWLPGKGVAQEKAFMEAFEKNFAQMDAAWAEFVKSY